MDQADQQYAFHRLARSWPQYRWWKPLLTGLLALGFYLALTGLLLIIGVILALATSADTQQYLAAAEAIDLSNPVIFAFTLLSLILMIPALGLSALLIGPKPVGLLSSVAGRIRWRWLATCVIAAVAVFLASLLVSTLLTFVFPEEEVAPPAQQDASVLWIMLALSLLAVPFQAAAEEYVFRGFLMQAIGSWLRHPAFAILLPIPLFVLGHGYGPLGQADVALFALFAGWISWRTGGLEAAIAVHAINNMTIFVLGAFGWVDVNSTEGSVSGLIVSVTTMTVTAVVIVRLADRRGIDRTRSAPHAVDHRRDADHALAGGPGHGWHRQAPAPAVPAGPAPFPVRSADARSWDADQYDAARYGSARPSAGVPWNGAAATGPAPVLGTSPGPSGRGPSLPQRPWRDPFGPGAERIPAPTPRPGGDAVDRHPAGPAHPPGPGYPSGTPHPPGPGYPGRSAADVGPDHQQGPDPQQRRDAPGTA